MLELCFGCSFFIFLGTLILTIAELEESKKIFRWYLILAFISLIFEVIGSLELINQGESMVSFTISNLILLFFLRRSRDHARLFCHSIHFDVPHNLGRGRRSGIKFRSEFA